MKTELEEAAEKYTIDSPQMSEIRKIAFKAGAKWQTERMYSEDEVIQLLIKFNQEVREIENVKDWFEQFKRNSMGKVTIEFDTVEEVYIKREFPKHKPKKDGFYITDYTGQYDHSTEWVKGDCFINYSGGVVDKKITWFLEKVERNYTEEEVIEIIKLSCEEGMLIQRTINDKVKIPYTRIKDFTIKMFEQFKKKN
jgi:hypothetical protein